MITGIVTNANDIMIFKYGIFRSLASSLIQKCEYIIRFRGIPTKAIAEEQVVITILENKLKLYLIKNKIKKM